MVTANKFITASSYRSIYQSSVRPSEFGCTSHKDESDHFSNGSSLEINFTKSNISLNWKYQINKKMLVLKIFQPYSTLWDWSCSIKSSASSLETTLTRLTLFLCVTPYNLSATFTSSGLKVVVINCVLAISARRRIMFSEQSN